LVGRFEDLPQLNIEDLEAEAAGGVALSHGFGKPDFIFSQLDGDMRGVGGNYLTKERLSSAMEANRIAHAGSHAARQRNAIGGKHVDMVLQCGEWELTGPRKICEF
jgi:hypothetical protein